MSFYLCYREEEVKYLANYVGIPKVYAGKNPEEKFDIVVKETQQAKTAYLGDGINDAPCHSWNCIWAQ